MANAPTIKVHCAHDKLIPVGLLNPHPKNRNKHPKEQIQRLAKILEYQGFRYPIKVSKLSGFITAGHGRLEAAKLLNLDSVPVNFQDYDSEEQEYADLVADNAIALWAEIDLSGVNFDLQDLGPDLDLDMLGLKRFTVDPSEKSTDPSPNRIATEFLLSVQCQNEHQREKLSDELSNRGLTCKIIK